MFVGDTVALNGKEILRISPTTSSSVSPRDKFIQNRHLSRFRYVVSHVRNLLCSLDTGLTKSNLIRSNVIVKLNLIISLYWTTLNKFIPSTLQKYSIIKSVHKFNKTKEAQKRNVIFVTEIHRREDTTQKRKNQYS